MRTIVIIGSEKRDHLICANSKIPFLTVYNSGSTVATDLNFGMLILSSFCNTRKNRKPSPLPVWA